MDITFHGTPLRTNATPPAVGDQLPQAPTGAALAGYTLISVVPDINTSVCSISTKHFNQAMDDFAGIKFYTVSTNTAAQ